MSKRVLYTVGAGSFVVYALFVAAILHAANREPVMPPPHERAQFDEIHELLVGDTLSVLTAARHVSALMDSICVHYTMKPCQD